jgi:hypothetical protein
MEAALRRHRQPEMIEKIEQKVAKKTKENSSKPFI